MMTLSALNQFLKQHTTEETQRLNGVKKDYSQFPVARGKFDTPCYRFDTNLEDLRSLFLSKKVLPSYYNFAVVKQDRFENVPLHIHEWLELSYIYSGSCTMTINKTTFRLKAGQMVLISQNAPHSVKRCSENDIIINFLLTREYLNRDVDTSLSGGEVKRIEIASLLAKNSRLMIFDEPEAGIDLWSFARLTETFRELHEKGGRTILIISHQERIIRLADEIILIANGEIAGRGTADELYPKLLSQTVAGCNLLEVNGIC